MICKVELNLDPEFFEEQVDFRLVYQGEKYFSGNGVLMIWPNPTPSMSKFLVPRPKVPKEIVFRQVMDKRARPGDLVVNTEFNTCEVETDDWPYTLDSVEVYRQVTDPLDPLSIFEKKEQE